MKAQEFEMTYKFICPGPDRIGGYSGMVVLQEKIGAPTTIFECLYYPDCSCYEYRKAVDKMEELED